MGIFDRFSRVSRGRKIKLFFDQMKPSATDKVLDVGGQVETGNSSSLQLADVFPYKNNISIVNISPEHIKLISKVYPMMDARVGDACNLPWPDNHFDIVYSNAVIEHVGNFEKQKKMASEIMRVAKRWFVTTPNRWYPFEFHLRLPFVTWLPFHGYLLAGRLIRYDHIARRYMVGCPKAHLRLMTAGELKKCFPNSQIVRQRVTFMPETLIAIGKKL